MRSLISESSVGFLWMNVVLVMFSLSQIPSLDYLWLRLFAVYSMIGGGFLLWSLADFCLFTLLWVTYPWLWFRRLECAIAYFPLTQLQSITG